MYLYIAFYYSFFFFVGSLLVPSYYEHLICMWPGSGILHDERDVFLYVRDASRRLESDWQKIMSSELT